MVLQIKNMHIKDEINYIKVNQSAVESLIHEIMIFHRRSLESPLRA